MVLWQLAKSSVITDLHEGVLPSELSFVQLRPSSLVISAVKAPEEGKGLIARFYNTEDHTVQADVSQCGPIRRAMIVNLNEETLRELRTEKGNKASLPVRGKGIMTLRFERA